MDFEIQYLCQIKIATIFVARQDQINRIGQTVRTRMYRRIGSNDEIIIAKERWTNTDAVDFENLQNVHHRRRLPCATSRTIVLIP